MNKKNVKKIINKLYNVDGIFISKRLSIHASKDFYDTIKNIYPHLTIGNACHLFRREVFHELKCKNPTCNNIITKRARAIKTQNIYFGFLQHCCKACATSDPKRSKKINKTQIDRYGGIGFASKKTSKKAYETINQKYNVPYYVVAPDFQKKSKATYMKNWGTEKPMGTVELRRLHEHVMEQRYGVKNGFMTGSSIRKKIKKIMIKKYGDEQIMATNYIREMKVKNGEWSNNRTDFEVYKSNVLRETRKTLRQESFKNIEKRARAGTDGAYHLDHKYSILSGFNNQIDPKIIGGKNNLIFIPANINTSKRSNNSIKLATLLELAK
jgi:hypothetical protein